MQPETRFLADDSATAAFGAELAGGMRAGCVVLLVGELGAGKTALARAMLRTLLGDPGLEVPSPSFSLVQPYEGRGRAVLHADLYRLTAPREIDELGLFDRPDAIVLVEWPERAPELFDRTDLVVTLAVPPDGRGRTATLQRYPPRQAG